MKRSYDTIAGIYDSLAALLIGKALRKAQVYLVQCIPPLAKVLIAGGGTGWIMEEIAKIHPEGLTIDYIDISAKMIAIAKKRNTGGNSIRFVQQSILTIAETNNYDVIITPFVLDNFKEENMKRIFHSLDEQLHSEGLWMYADFQVMGKHKNIQKVTLSIMYAFFRAVCGIEASHLPDVVNCFAKYRYDLIQSSTFKHHFIVASVYKKSQQ